MFDQYPSIDRLNERYLERSNVYDRTINRLNVRSRFVFVSFLFVFVWMLFSGRQESYPLRRRSAVVRRIVSSAEKKVFDRGGPVWPPRSNAEDDRSGEALPP